MKIINIKCMRIALNIIYLKVFSDYAFSKTGVPNFFNIGLHGKSIAE